MTDNKTQKEYPVSLLWQIVAQKKGEHTHKISEIIDLTKHMFPGIKWGMLQTSKVLRTTVTPELKSLFTDLAEHQSDVEAIKALGEKIAVPEIRNIEGHDWELGVE